MAQFPGPCQRNRHARTRTGKHPMKIVKLEDFHVDGGWDTYSFLKITTDEGVTGWSEFNESRRRGMIGVVQGLGAALIGRDPREVGRIDATLYAQSRPTAGGLTSHAIAAIVNACLDIKGKALGVPVYELLGGALRDRMPVYWSRCGVLRARCADIFDGKVIDRPCAASTISAGPPAKRASAVSRPSRPTCCCSMPRAGGSSPPAWLAPASVTPSSISPTTSSTP